MAHMIDESTGKAAIAYVGEKPWHGLGEELKQDATIEEWIEAASMGWDIIDTPVRFNLPDGKVSTYPNKRVLYRNDTMNPLGIVGDDFKIVQPREVVEFFRDLVEIHDMKLSVAGVLFNGKRFWATAETGRVAEVLPGDEVRGQLLLMTGADGTLATSAKFVSTRVVCNNTLRLAINEEGGRQVRKTHRTLFDAQEVKIDLGLIDGTWDKYITDMKKLTTIKMSDDKAKEFFTKLIKRPKIDDMEVSKTTQKTVDELMYRLRHGLGAESGRGTAWNVLNAVTEKYTHGTARRNKDVQFTNSVYGGDANMKDKALEMLLAA